MSYIRKHWVEGETNLGAANFNNIEDGVEEALAKAGGNSDMWEYIRNLVYPVGAIYMSVNNTDPSLLFGGTWVRWGQGRVPVGVNSSDANFNYVEKPGGSANAVVVSHDHTASFTGNAVGTHTHNGPSHTHTMAHTHLYNRPPANTGDHVLTVNEIPSHNHPTGYYSEHNTTYALSHTGVKPITAEDNDRISTGYTGGGQGHHHTISISPAATGSPNNANTGAAGTGATSAAGGHTPSGSVSVASRGESGTGKNLQPYITCYMWKRTA